MEILVSINEKENDCQIKKRSWNKTGVSSDLEKNVHCPCVYTCDDDLCNKCDVVAVQAVTSSTLEKGRVYTILGKLIVPENSENFPFCVLSSDKVMVKARHCEIFEKVYVLVTVCSETDLRVATNQTIAMANFRVNSHQRKHLLTSVQHEVFLDTLSARHLQPREYTEIKLSIYQMQKQFSITKECRYEPVKLVRTLYLDPEIQVETMRGIPEMVFTSSELNLLCVRVFNTSPNVKTLFQDKPLFLAKTCLDLAGLELYMSHMERSKPELIDIT